MNLHRVWVSQPGEEPNPADLFSTMYSTNTMPAPPTLLCRPTDAGRNPSNDGITDDRLPGATDDGLLAKAGAEILADLSPQNKGAAVTLEGESQGQQQISLSTIDQSAFSSLMQEQAMWSMLQEVGQNLTPKHPNTRA